MLSALSSPLRFLVTYGTMLSALSSPLRFLVTYRTILSALSSPLRFLVTYGTILSALSSPLRFMVTYGTMLSALSFSLRSLGHLSHYALNFISPSTLSGQRERPPGAADRQGSFWQMPPSASLAKKKMKPRTRHRAEPQSSLYG